MIIIVDNHLHSYEHSYEQRRLGDCPTSTTALLLVMRVVTVGRRGILVGRDLVLFISITVLAFGRVARLVVVRLVVGVVMRVVVMRRIVIAAEQVV